jgi:Domain of unknown function (DUF4160)
MYYKDHAPPHFHALYGDYEITVEITSGVVKGEFPRRALSAVLEWYSVHKEELLNHWETASEGNALARISPLE